MILPFGVLSIVLGLIGIIAGIIVLSNPLTAGVAIVWVVGLYAVLYGSILIAFSFRAQAELEK